MAIHDQIEVRIFVKNDPILEYDNPDGCLARRADDQVSHPDGEACVEKCIESTPGENFAIEMKVRDGFEIEPDQALSFKVALDGRNVENILAFGKEFLKGWGWVHTLRGISYSSQNIWQLRKFKFETLRTDREASRGRFSVAHVAKIGTVRIVVRLAKLKKMSSPDLAEPDRTKPGIRVSEKHLKGHATDSHTG